MFLNAEMQKYHIDTFYLFELFVLSANGYQYLPKTVCRK